MEKISIRLEDGVMIGDAGKLQVLIDDGEKIEIRRVDELVRMYRERLSTKQARSSDS